jgi:hypothetical protein
VAYPNGRPCLTRLGAICEQIAELVEDGVQVIFVSSGAVGMGKRLLRKQNKLLMSFKDIQNHSHTAEDVDSNITSSPISSSRSFLSLLQNPELPHTSAQKQKHYDSACADVLLPLLEEIRAKRDRS